MNDRETHSEAAARLSKDLPDVTRDKPMKSGEGTFFEIGGCYRRYHAPLCRTVFL